MSNPIFKALLSKFNGICSLAHWEHLSEASEAETFREEGDGKHSNNRIRESALKLCIDIAGSRGIFAAGLYGPWVCGYADDKSYVNVFLVLRNRRYRLTVHDETLNGIKILILAVDQQIFEKDVEQGWFGEFIAGKITVPYEPLINGEYLRQQEVKVKKRIIQELLENIVSEYPELSHELLIREDYFMYEAMMRRARVFSPITYAFLNMLNGGVKRKNTESILDGYQRALSELAEEGHITLSNEYIEISLSFIKAARSRMLRIPSLFRSVQRAAFLNILGVFPKMMMPLVQEKDIFVRTHSDVEVKKMIFQLFDPRKYLFIPTPLGFSALSDKTTIEDFVKKIVPSEEILEMKMEEIGGVLNTVYLLTFRQNQEEQRVVVKKFKDWLSVKWFPLTIWTLGTKTFAVLGRSRMEREFAINRFLSRQGFSVPRVLYLSPQERLIFEDYVEGENMVEIIKRVTSSKVSRLEEVTLVKEAGRKIAEVHSLGVSLGDCKPENIIITEGGKICFVDLEQASRNGNKAWDVAEFLYYSGHYVSPIASTASVIGMAREFIKGYLEAGGLKETVKRAGSARYTKVFSIFTPPHVILALSNLCKKLGSE